MTGTAPARSLAQLAGSIGQEIGLSRWFEIPQSLIDAYADICQDRQYIHTDPARAKTTPFGGTIAHGFLTMGLLSAMAYEAVPLGDDVRMSVNYGFDRVRFLAPVPSGARVRGRFVLADMVERQLAEYTLTWDVTVEIEGQDKPALIATWITRRYGGDAA